MTKNKQILSILLVLLLLAVAGFFLFKGNPSEPEVTYVDTSIDDDTPQETDSSLVTDGEETNEGSETPENPKTPQLSGEVTDKPIVSTSYGLVADAPITDGQLVSTSCATEPQVDCVIELSNAESNELIIFDVKQTSSLGNAVWEWYGGEDVPSGTWSVVAKAGDKVSNAETIYVQ